MIYPWFLSVTHFLYSSAVPLYIKIISWFQLLSYLTIIPRSITYVQSPSFHSSFTHPLLQFLFHAALWVTFVKSIVDQNTVLPVNLKVLTLATRVLCNFVSAYLPLEPHSLPLSPLFRITATVLFTRRSFLRHFLHLFFLLLPLWSFNYSVNVTSSVRSSLNYPI